MSVAARCLHGAGVCVIPMSVNDHRPYMLRHKPLAAVSLLLIVSKVLAFTVLALTPASAELSTITSARIIQLTNAQRTKAGLSPLQVTSLLTQAATQKANHMLEEDYFAHISPSGVTPWFWMSKAGYNYQLAGENLAIDFFEAEDVVQAWLASPGHRDNMLQSEYTQTGVAVATGEFQGGTSIVVVHMFGRPTVASATTKTDPSPSPSLAPSSTPKPPPTLTPLPTPSVAPAPRTPRIALRNDISTVQNTLPISVEADREATVHFEVNGQALTTRVLHSELPVTYSLSVADLPDGNLSILAYTTTSLGGRSDASATLHATKDTAGPTLAVAQIPLVVSPRTDAAQMLVRPNLADTAAFEMVVAGVTHSVSPLTDFITAIPSAAIAATGIDEAGNRTTVHIATLTPSFATTTPAHELAAPKLLSQLTRRMASVIVVTLLILLFFAIIIRIRIQHAALITHTSLVILLASLFFFF